MSVKEISAKPKGLLGPEIAGVNQILPIYYPWAWEGYLICLKNTWVPSETSMSVDIQQWNSKTHLTEDERLIVKRCLGFFAGSESLVANNLLLSIFKYVTNGEARQFVLAQAFQECLHNHTVVYCCDSLGLTVSELYEAYINIPSIKDKDDFLMGITTDLNRKDFDICTLEGKRELLRNIITYYAICEGSLFYVSFLMCLSLGRQGKMPGLATQIQFTLRDEAAHVSFGINLINEIRKEYPKLWTKEFERETIEHFSKAIELEMAFARETLPNGILGLNVDMIDQYMPFLVNMRLESMGISHRFDNASNPFPWLSELVELPKAKNFFETTVTEYQTGNLIDDL